jgi:osmotically-inducible protein OsmY
VAVNADDAVSQRIRKAIMNDQTLATGANDVQVTTINGTLTLRGTVPSEELKKSIEAKAQLAAGIARVDNQLQVKN